MNAKAIIPLVAGLIVGGLALKLGLTKLNSASGAQVQMVQIWAAREDIPRGTAIDEAMLTELPFPAKSVPTGAFTEKDKEKLINRVARIGAPANLPILDSMLLAPGEQAGIHVPDGYRAVAVKVDESSGVGRHLVPGCHVDVVGFFNVRAQDGKTETISRTIIENVEVAAVGERISAETPAEPGGKASKSEKAKPAAAVTLLVKPEQVPVVHLAEQQGKLKLSMRGKSDMLESADHRTVKGDDVVGKASGDSKKSMSNAFAAFFGSQKDKPKQTHVAPQPDAVQAATPPPPPPPAWVMRIVNGNAQQTYGWQKLNSMEAVWLNAPGDSTPKGGKAPPGGYAPGIAAPNSRGSNPDPTQVNGPKHDPKVNDPGANAGDSSAAAATEPPPPPNAERSGNNPDPNANQVPEEQPE